MPSGTSHVAKVRKLYPEWADEVALLAMRNETFRSLCEEYGLAAETLDRLELRNRPQDVEKMHEYRALIRDLEKELKYELLASHGRPETNER